MKDFFGQELNIGDKVAVTPKDYRGLVEATIISLTPKNVRVTYNTSWSEREYLVPPDALIRFPEDKQ